MRALFFVIVILYAEGLSAQAVRVETQICNSFSCRGRFLGSGIAVHQANGMVYVLTNRHVVVHDVPPGYSATLSVVLGQDPIRSTIVAVGASLLGESNVDLALLRVPYRGTARIAKVAAQSPKNSSTVYLSSFIGGTRYIKQPTVYGHDLQFGNGETMDITDTAFVKQRTVSGQSGGGVFNDEGELVGVLWGMDAPPPLLSRNKGVRLQRTGPTRYSYWATCVEYDVMVRFLDKHAPNIGWEVVKKESPSAPPPPPKSPAWEEPIKNLREGQAAGIKLLDERFKKQNEASDVRFKDQEIESSKRFSSLKGLILNRAKAKAVPWILTKMGVGATGGAGLALLVAWKVGGALWQRRKRRRTPAPFPIAQPITRQEPGPPVQLPPQTSVRLVNVPVVNMEAEMLKEALAREVGVNPRAAELVRRVLRVSSDLLHGQQITQRKEAEKQQPTSL